MDKYLFVTYIFGLTCVLAKLVHYFFPVVKVNMYLKEDKPQMAPVDKNLITKWHVEQRRKGKELEDFGIEELK